MQGGGGGVFKSSALLSFPNAVMRSGRGGGGGGILRLSKSLNSMFALKKLNSGGGRCWAESGINYLALLFHPPPSTPHALNNHIDTDASWASSTETPSQGAVIVRASTASGGLCLLDPRASDAAEKKSSLVGGGGPASIQTFISQPGGGAFSLSVKGQNQR